MNRGNENERLAIFEVEDRTDIKNSIERKLKVIGVKSKYGWDWETPYVSVMVDSKRVMIT